jgi:peptidylprolyl isomerase
MRTAVALLCSGLVLAGCSGDKAKPAPTNPAGQLPGVTGAFGQKPVVAPPSGQPPKTLESRVVSEGPGRAAANENLLLVHYLGQTWREGKPFDESYTSGKPLSISLGAGQVIAGWEEKLVGAKAGSRHVLSIPPEKAYGAEGKPPQILGNDTLLFVVDVLGVYDKSDAANGKPVAQDTSGKLPKVVGEPGKRPQVKMPSKGTKPPTKTVSKTILQGEGPPVQPGQVVVQQVVLQTWGSAKPVAATWDERSPVATGLNNERLPQGWEDVLVGTKVGTRLLAVLPPNKAFGKSGNPQLRVKPSDTLVLVIDILDAR